jgi:hypothetical protein
MPLVYDAGALIAADLGGRRFALLHEKALADEDALPIVPAAVIGQVWRDGAKQARLARLLKSVSDQLTEVQTRLDLLTHDQITQNRDDSEEEA